MMFLNLFRTTTKHARKKMRVNEFEKEVEEINHLNKWIESQKPDSGSNPLSFGPLPKDAKIGILEDGENGTVFLSYAGVRKQRAAIPHSLCGRDILGAATTGSGKTLAFVIPILEKLHRERWSPEAGVGCIKMSGLLFKDEWKSGFVWLLKAWLKAMHGCYPRVILILTKHDHTLKEAVYEVFPSSKHCFYMWDTLGQMPEKLGHVIRQEKSLMDEIDEAIYGSCESGEFEKKWWEVVDRFQKRNNAWLQSLYEDREYWLHVSMKDVSLAGMCTDSVNFVFDKYIHRKTTIKVFLDQYKRDTNRKRKQRWRHCLNNLDLSHLNRLGSKWLRYTHVRYSRSFRWKCWEELLVIRRKKAKKMGLTKRRKEFKIMSRTVLSSWCGTLVHLKLYVHVVCLNSKVIHVILESCVFEADDQVMLSKQIR